MKPNLDSKLTFPVDLAPNKIPLAVLNQLEKCIYNANFFVSINQIQKKKFCVHNITDLFMNSK